MQKFIRYVVFKPNTGEVIRYGVCEENALPNQVNEGEDVIVGGFCGSQYVEDGALVNIPECPTQHHIFDYTTKQWIDLRTLDDHKSAKWKEIKRQRDVAEFATFTYNNMEFDGDLDAQRRLTAYISVSKSSIAAGQPFEAEFTLANNTNVTLTAQDFVGIELAKVQAVAATFNHASALRAQIDAATTVQEVEAITW